MNDAAAVYGRSDVFSGNGVIGEAFGSASYAIYGRTDTGYAGHFVGRVEVVGALSKSSGSFQIDHPLDPENKYLAHSFVESPDMMNVYNGNVVTDGGGEAVIELPNYFQALNRDFRYQLTTIRQPAMAWVSQEIHQNRFSIKTDKPGVKVSWQVTGIRQDPWAETHRIEVEPLKDDTQRGYYLHPELYGRPKERNMDGARNAAAEKRAKQAGASHTPEK